MPLAISGDSSNASPLMGGLPSEPAEALPCWCGEGEWQVCFRKPRASLLRCSACGSFQTEPPPLARRKEAPAQRESHPEAARPRASRNAWFWRVAEKVPQLLEARVTAVDIGAGEGHFCAELRAAGWPRVTGFEFSPSRIAVARRLYPQIPFHSCSLHDAGIPESSLDLIVLEDVIEHLPNPAAIVGELARYLAPGGNLVILTPNMESGHFRLLGSRWTGMLAPHSHVFLFTGSGLAQLLLRCGLSIRKRGSVHPPFYRIGEYARRLFSGDIKGTLWRAHQEIGAFYGKLIGAGPMLYAVATRPAN